MRTIIVTDVAYNGKYEYTGKYNGCPIVFDPFVSCVLEEDERLEEGKTYEIEGNYHLDGAFIVYDKKPILVA